MDSDAKPVERCDGCRFWSSNLEECHRRAPTVLPTFVSLSTTDTEVGCRDHSIAKENGLREDTLAQTPAPAQSKRGNAPLKQIGVWPQTPSSGWCGEWSARTEEQIVALPRVGAYSELAASIFLERLDPALEITNAVEVLAVLLNQLRPDLRRVIVRVHGLDGKPVEALRGVARELKMERTRLQALLTMGEQRLAKIIQTFAVGQHRKQ